MKRAEAAEAKLAAAATTEEKSAAEADAKPDQEKASQVKEDHETLSLQNGSSPKPIRPAVKTKPKQLRFA